MSKTITSWIWTSERLPERNAFVRFRKLLDVGSAKRIPLRISADSRYWIWLNGEFLGSGPVRSWSNHWKYDEYDLYLESGKNVVAVLVNHWGVGNFQYIPANPGLWVETRGTTFKEGWKCSASKANLSSVPRISVQEAFEEQFDARKEEPWTTLAFNDSEWADAIKIEPPHESLEPSGIPHLTRERVIPQRIVRAQEVSPPAQTWTIDVKRHILPEDRESNMLMVRGFLFTQIWSEKAQAIEFVRPHHHGSEIKLNGKVIPALATGMEQTIEVQKARLKAGWNKLVVPYPDINSEVCNLHMAQFVLTVRSAGALEWSATRKTGSPAWMFVGPFEFTPQLRNFICSHMDYPRLSISEPQHPEAICAAFEQLYADAGRRIDISNLPYAHAISSDCIVQNDVFALAAGDKVTGPAVIKNPEALLSENSQWTVIPGSPGASDVRVLLDFGREVVGPHEFEIDAAEGTIVDFFNFEFIQPDARENYAEGMNNSFRYICRGGSQRYRSLLRRGFRYSYITFRNIKEPVRIRSVTVDFMTYPQARQGWFECSDTLLNKIWKVGAHTLRCCAEDTYTDCPSYEQTHWVGDARNEALIDWVVNGDFRLWFRCLEQVGQSLELEHNVITASQVPSSWANILPCWSFLWMRSCREYLLWTGDFSGAAKLLKWVERNVDGIESHLNEQGLFKFQGWNMFDWADMDTPSDGIITHLNCFAVLALRDCAELARWINNTRMAARYEKLADGIAAAINAHLWDSLKKAYIDCIHADGKKSTIFSQQTATAALISGVATGDREKYCRKIVHHPPKGFVKAGSPFFEFFLLELLKAEQQENAFLNTIKKDWGFMIEQGATTFWELWSLRRGRLTRSHCHGWSAAPTFFLSSTVLGIEPTKPGFAEVRITPRLGNLQFVRGAMPTPHGLIEVSVRRMGNRVNVAYKLPKGVRLQKSKGGDEFCWRTEELSGANV